jgi:hypothetical protein
VAFCPPPSERCTWRIFSRQLKPAALPAGLTHLRLGCFNRPLAVGILPPALISLDLGHFFDHPLPPGQPQCTRHSQPRTHRTLTQPIATSLCLCLLPRCPALVTPGVLARPIQSPPVSGRCASRRVGGVALELPRFRKRCRLRRRRATGGPSSPEPQGEAGAAHLTRYLTCGSPVVGIASTTVFERADAMDTSRSPGLLV